MTAPWATQALTWGLPKNQAVADKGRRALGKRVCPSVGVVVTALQAPRQLLTGSRPTRLGWAGGGAGLGQTLQGVWPGLFVSWKPAAAASYRHAPDVASTASWRTALVPHGRDGRACSDRVSSGRRARLFPPFLHFPSLLWNQQAPR